MATPQASDLLSDGQKALKALELGVKILEANRTLAADIDTINSVASKAENINCDKIDLLKNFRDSLLKLRAECDAVTDAGANLGKVEAEMNRSMRQIIKSSEKTANAVKKCLDELEKLLDSANVFGQQYQNFRDCLGEVIDNCKLLHNKLEDLYQKAQAEASRTRRQGYGAAAGMGAGAALSMALGIAGFFTLGATWAPAAALAAGTAAGTGLAIGAGVVGVNTKLDIQELDRKANKLKETINDLKVGLRQLDQVFESATGIVQFSEDTRAAIADTLEMYKERHRVLEKEENFQKKQELSEARIRELEEENRALKKKRCMIM